MTKRLAKKIYRDWRTESRDRLRRAALRLFESPLLLTTSHPPWFNVWQKMGFANHGRAILISPKCIVIEQRGWIHDAVKRDGRIYFERRMVG